MFDIIEINGQTVVPGQNTQIKIHVGKLPSDTRIHINIHVFRSTRPGPTLLILGGVHGDEVNGIEIVRRLLAEDAFLNLQSGSVIAIPILNIYGFINFSRDVPDGKDVNRSFPGTQRGSLASRVANALTRHVMPHVDFAVDFHTGGNARYNYPQVRYTGKDRKARILAEFFHAPFIIRKGMIARSLRKTAFEMDVPVLVFEGGESLRLSGFTLSVAMDGVKRLMAANEMIDYTSPYDRKCLLINKTTWVRASYSGLFTWHKPSGHPVRKGEPLGVIHDPDGQRKIFVRSKRDGYLMGHNNAPVVNVGDALFLLGYDAEELPDFDVPSP
jgi:predicted deacylase